MIYSFSLSSLELLYDVQGRHFKWYKLATSDECWVPVSTQLHQLHFHYSPIENLQPYEGHISDSLPTYVTRYVSIPLVRLQGVCVHVCVREYR